MQVAYEWAVETVDEHEDILDTDGWDTFAEAWKRASQLAARIGTRDDWADSMIVRIDIALCRHLGRDLEVDGIEDREYAYLDFDGKLPENFETLAGRPGARVPKKFHQEVKRGRN